MRNKLYIILEFISGLGLSLVGVWIFWTLDNSSALNRSIFFGYLIMGLCMFVGVALVGYFHFKANNNLREMPKALVRSFLTLNLFCGIYVGLLILFPGFPGFLSILFPLTGAVLGLNFNFKTLGIPI